MASLALGVAGAALGNFILPGVGGIIGGALGSLGGALIDNMLFKKVSLFQEGPRLGDLSVMSSSYGSPIPKCYGVSVRLATNIIWTSGMQEDTHYQTQTAGGKGGGGQSVTSVS